jgi:hypothetical protein
MLLQPAAIDEGLATGFYSPADPNELVALAAQVTSRTTLPSPASPPSATPAAGPARDPYHGASTGDLARRRQTLDSLVRWQ